MTKSKLPVRQKLFIKYYLADPERNVERAATRAGYSAKTAASQGRRLLQNVAIKSEIEKSLNKIAKQLDFEAIDVIKRTKELAFADIGDILSFSQTEGIKLKSSGELTPGQRASIRSIQLHPKNGFKITFESKQGHLDTLHKYFGTLSEGAQKPDNLPEISEDEAEELINKVLNGKAKRSFK